MKKSDHMPKKPLGLIARKGSVVLQFSRKIPGDLKGFYPPHQTHIRKSLGTSDMDDAKRLCVKLWAELDDHFAALRLRLAPSSVDTITPELTEAIVAQIKHTALKLDDDTRYNPTAAAFLHHLVTAARPLYVQQEGKPEPRPFVLPPSDQDGLTLEQREGVAWLNDHHAQQATEALAAGKLAGAKKAAQDAAQALGVSLRGLEDTSEAQELFRAVARAQKEAADALQARDQGQPVATPEAPAFKVGGEKTLRWLHKSWSTDARNPVKPDSIKRNLRGVELFEQMVGPDIPIDQITREHARQFADALALKYQNSRTGKDRFIAVATLLNHAVSMEWLSRNRLKGMAPAFEVKRPREIWEDADVVQLFDSPLFKAYAIPEGADPGMDAAYWVPLLALYSGARIGELAKLLVSDVVYEDSSPARFIIYKSKTTAGQREVMIHPDLIRLGFLDYVAAMKAQGRTRLFPATGILPDGTQGKYLSDWFGRYRAEQGAEKPGQDFHSFRTTVRTKLADEDSPEWATYLRRPTDEDVREGLATGEDWEGDILTDTVQLTGDPRKPYVRLTATGKVVSHGHNLAAMLGL